MSIVRVAKLAGVSHTTVSRVMNGQPGVSTETADAVREAMDQLGYRPSARRPGPKPSATRGRPVGTNLLFLGLGTSLRSGPAFEGVTEGMTLAARGQRVSLGFTHVSAESPLPEDVIPEGTAGLLLHGAKPTPEMSARLKRLPAVWLMGQRYRPEWGDQVMTDATRVGELAANYLLSRGHKSLAFLNLDRDYWVLRLYRDAFRSAAEEAGASVEVLEYERQQIDVHFEEYTPGVVDRFVDRFLHLPHRPTGLFIAGDLQTSVLQPALQRQGVRIGPGHTEIVSCNNERSFLVGLRPTPAVIDIRTVQIGQCGIDQLLWRIAHPEIPGRVLTMVEPFLIPPEAAR